MSWFHWHLIFFKFLFRKSIFLEKVDETSKKVGYESDMISNFETTQKNEGIFGKKLRYGMTQSCLLFYLHQFFVMHIYLYPSSQKRHRSTPSSCFFSECRV